MLLALLLAAAPADVAWVSGWMNGNSGKPGVMSEWHDAYPSSPHASGAREFEATQRTQRVVKNGDAAKLAEVALALLKNPKAEEQARGRAARVLGWLQWDAAIPALREALDQGSYDAAHALGFFGDVAPREGALVFGGRFAATDFPAHPNDAALDALLNAQKDEDLRQEVIDQLRNFSGPKVDVAWRKLAEGCKSPEAIVWLEKYEGVDRLEVVKKCADAADVSTRAKAMVLLARLSGRAELPRFLAALDDADETIFLAAHESLSLIAGHVGTPPEASIIDREFLAPLWRKHFAQGH